MNGNELSLTFLFIVCIILSQSVSGSSYRKNASPEDVSSQLQAYEDAEDGLSSSARGSNTYIDEKHSKDRKKLRFSQAFVEADKNGNGSLTRKELMDYYIIATAESHYPLITEEITSLERRMNKIRANPDDEENEGFTIEAIVDRLDELSSKTPEYFAESSTHYDLQHGDKDADGVLTKKEWFIVRGIESFGAAVYEEGDEDVDWKHIVDNYVDPKVVEREEATKKLNEENDKVAKYTMEEIDASIGENKAAAVLRKAIIENDLGTLTDEQLREIARKYQLSFGPDVDRSVIIYKIRLASSIENEELTNKDDPLAVEIQQLESYVESYRLQRDKERKWRNSFLKDGSYPHESDALGNIVYYRMVMKGEITPDPFWNREAAEKFYMLASDKSSQYVSTDKLGVEQALLPVDTQFGETPRDEEREEFFRSYRKKVLTEGVYPSKDNVLENVVYSHMVDSNEIIPHPAWDMETGRAHLNADQQLGHVSSSYVATMTSDGVNPTRQSFDPFSNGASVHTPDGVPGQDADPRGGADHSSSHDEL